MSFIVKISNQLKTYLKKNPSADPTPDAENPSPETPARPSVPNKSFVNYFKTQKQIWKEKHTAAKQMKHRSNCLRSLCSEISGQTTYDAKAAFKKEKQKFLLTFDANAAQFEETDQQILQQLVDRLKAFRDPVDDVLLLLDEIDRALAKYLKFHKK